MAKATTVHLSPKERRVLETILREQNSSTNTILRKCGVPTSTALRIRSKLYKNKTLIDTTYFNAEPLQGYNFNIIARVNDHNASYEAIIKQLPRIISMQTCFIDNEPAYSINLAIPNYNMDMLDSMLNAIRQHIHPTALNVIRLKGMPINLQWSVDSLLGALPDGNKDPEMDNETELEVPQ